MLLEDVTGLTEVVSLESQEDVITLLDSWRSLMQEGVKWTEVDKIYTDGSHYFFSRSDNPSDFNLYSSIRYLTGQQGFGIMTAARNIDWSKSRGVIDKPEPVKERVSITNPVPAEPTVAETTVMPVVSMPDVTPVPAIEETETTLLDVAVIPIVNTETGQMFSLGGSGCLGRSSKACGFSCTKSTTVSRKHLAYQVLTEGLQITDLNSSNGTFVNGRRISPGKPYLVTAGMTFTLADVDFKVK